MKIFEPLMLKFENPKWINDPELGLIDTVLEEHPCPAQAELAGI
jgi:hypothetical protein